MKKITTIERESVTYQKKKERKGKCTLASITVYQEWKEREARSAEGNGRLLYITRKVKADVESRSTVRPVAKAVVEDKLL
ncbi:hypothetical protein SO802_027363 [Lithocarpus litseifolius]|uniref:Uncharacterized protein n=1 Tax=Lithocarpus litseifolius TaxID=425828 RepID=A0AAW2C362_9ROSI